MCPFRVWLGEVVAVSWPLLARERAISLARGGDRRTHWYMYLNITQPQTSETQDRVVRCDARETAAVSKEWITLRNLTGAGCIPLECYTRTALSEEACSTFTNLR